MGEAEPTDGAFEKLVPIVYDDLRMIARGHLRRSGRGMTLDTTALAHEAWVRLVDQDAVDWNDRGHFFAVYSLVAGLTVIPISPGSVGVAEVALIGMLTPIVGSEFVNEVAAGVLLYRLLTWLLMIPAGLIALAVWRARRTAPTPARAAR